MYKTLHFTEPFLQKKFVNVFFESKEEEDIQASRMLYVNNLHTWHAIPQQ